jgi:hypothetical protein
MMLLAVVHVNDRLQLDGKMTVGGGKLAGKILSSGRNN